MSGEPAIDGDRLLRRLARFAEIGGTPAGGVNRQALSEEDGLARALLADLARARGFSVAQDAMANLFVRREGADPALPPLLVGSHLDSQPTGGRYDGALGVLTAFEVLEALEDAGAVTGRAVEVVAWTNEEGSRFAPGAMGSKAFAEGAMPPAWAEVRDGAGIRLADALAATRAGLAGAGERPLGFAVAGYLELHIEQGPVLEREGIPIGIVVGIQGTRWLEVVVTGQAAHAGTTPAAFRRDPLAAAAAAVDGLNRALMPADPEARFTVGRMTVAPGSVNAIAERVNFSVDLRHPDAESLDRLEAAVRAGVAAAAAAHGCAATVERTLDMPPARFDEALIGALEAAAAEVGAPCRRLTSGAFHDALFVARVAPAAMLFVPCRDGLSHNEAEFVAPDDVVRGAQVLLAAVRRG